MMINFDSVDRYLAAALLMLAALPAHAGVIYDNGPLARGGGGVDSIGVVANAQLADDFVLTAGATITDIHWYGAGGTFPADDDFVIRLFEDGGGVPTSEAFLELSVGHVDRVETDFDVPFAHVNRYAVDVAPIDLDLNRTYWISIDNTIGASWLWSVAGTGNAHIRSLDDPGSWTSTSFGSAGMGFYLTDDALTVAEPSSFLLLATGLLAVIRRRL